jgi:WhiB family redox-sensing transcriptional regulator
MTDIDDLAWVLQKRATVRPAPTAQRRTGFEEIERLIPAVDWKLDGLCTKTNPRKWFPETAGEARWNNEKAKAICAVCPVRQTCLEDALAKGEAGIWGGTTEDERADMRAAANRTVAA